MYRRSLQLAADARDLVAAANELLHAEAACVPLPPPPAAAPPAPPAIAGGSTAGRSRHVAVARECVPTAPRVRESVRVPTRSGRELDVDAANAELAQASRDRVRGLARQAAGLRAKRVS
jgi:hypothetical protein